MSVISITSGRPENSGYLEGIATISLYERFTVETITVTVELECFAAWSSKNAAGWTLAFRLVDPDISCLRATGILDATDLGYEKLCGLMISDCAGKNCQFKTGTSLTFECIDQRLPHLKYPGEIDFGIIRKIFKNEVAGAGAAVQKVLAS